MSTNVSRCFSDQSFPFPRMTTKLCFDKCKFFFFFLKKYHLTSISHDSLNPSTG